MELEKIYGSGGAVPASSARRTHAKEDTSDTFARMLQNMREAKPVNSYGREDLEGDTVVTRVLADGSVITQIYKGTTLISETTTPGTNPEAGKALISERVERLKLDEDAAQNPLLDSHAARTGHRSTHWHCGIIRLIHAADLLSYADGRSLCLSRPTSLFSICETIRVLLHGRDNSLEFN